MRILCQTVSRFILAFGLLTLVPKVRAEESTAFELMKEANRYVGEQAKDRVVQIRSEKSIGSLSPTIWYVVFRDPTATFKAVEVKFGGGKMLDVKRPVRAVEFATGNKPMNRDRLKVDSDKAIKTASSESMLEKLTLKAVQAKLDDNADFGPVWKLKFWAAKLSNPNSQAEIGEIWVSADDGKVVKNDLHINRVD